MKFGQVWKEYYQPFFSKHKWLCILYAMIAVITYYLQLLFFPKVVTTSITSLKNKTQKIIGIMPSIGRKGKNSITSKNAKEIDKGWRPLLVICVTFFVLIGLHFIKNQMDAFIPTRHTQFVRETLFQQSMKQFQTEFQNISIGVYMSRYNALPREMRYLSETFMGLWPTMLMIVFITGFLFYYDIFLGLGFIIIHVMMTYLLFFSSYGKQCFEMAKQRAEFQLKTTDQVSQRIMNLDHIFINQQESNQIESHHQTEDKLGNLYFKTAGHTNKMVSITSFLSIVAFGWVMFRGWRLSIRPSHPFSNSETFTRLLLTMCFFQNSVLKMYPRMVSLIQGMMTTHVYLTAISTSSSKTTPTTPTPFPINNLSYFDIQINHLTFMYPNTTAPLFQNLSIHIPEGSRVLLQGTSGSGKSTLMKLLIRFYDVATNNDDVSKKSNLNSNSSPYPILVGGKEINKIPIEELRKHIKYIPQSTHLLNETIFENIKFGNETVTKEGITKIIEKYSLDRVLGKDLEKKCGAEGKDLSLGMQKVIVLLRGLSHHSTTNIFLLDEPFAGLDPQTRESVADMLFSLLSPRHTVMIANHVPLNDKILNRMSHTLHFPQHKNYV
jgi:ABC-type multidrug transport system fused ATPase/permease subunit